MKTINVKPILVESEALSKGHSLYITQSNELVKFSSFHSGYKSQQLVLINNNIKSKFEIGDLITDGFEILKATPCIFNAQDLIGRIKWSKIIAIQDQLPENYIQQFIEDYNYNNVKDIEIELTQESINIFIENKNRTFYGDYIPKLINGFIIIVEKIKEPILYTEIEMKAKLAQLINAYNFEMADQGFVNAVNETKFNLKEWFELNKKK